MSRNGGGEQESACVVFVVDREIKAPQLLATPEHILILSNRVFI